MKYNNSIRHRYRLYQLDNLDNRTSWNQCLVMLVGVTSQTFHLLISRRIPKSLAIQNPPISISN